MHLEPRQVAYATFLGVFLHLSYLASRSLIVPMTLHMLNNSISISMHHVPAAEFLKKQINKIQQSLKIPYSFRKQRLLGDLEKMRAKLQETLQKLETLKKRAFSVEKLVGTFVREEYLTDTQLER